jgi:beta-glucosidase/6-phospho-beta-glucosidase/beta-galactosidase
LEDRIKFINIKTVCPVYIAAILVIILLRGGVNIPVISSLSNPILAEKEKTYQLKTIMDWVVTSKYRNYALVLHREKQSPSYDPKGAINRSNIPPMDQIDVNYYMEMMRGGLEEQKDSSQKLIVTFGNEKIGNMYLLKSIEGMFAGEAMIFVLFPEDK